MTQITQLNSADSIADDDLLIIWDASAAATRKVTALQLANYVNAKQTFPSGVAESYYLDAQNRGVNVTINTTPQNFLWNVIATEIGTPSFNTSTSEFIFPFTGIYNFTFMYNVDVPSGTHQILSAAQTSNDGVTWSPVQYSARWETQRNGDNDQALFVSNNRFTAGQRIRFVTWATGGMNITTENPPNGAGFTIPASRILITGVRAQ
jgi:hypothetical protein